MAAKKDYSLTGKEIFNYVSKKEPSYSWKLVKTKTNPGKSKIYELKLISQTWRGIVWKHRLRIVIPAKVNKNNCLAAFMIAGSSGGDAELAIVSKIADKTCSPAAVLHDVPNQPLYGGLTEDALIAKTFMDFIENGKPADMLLFPMAKSVVKGMDAMTDFCKNKFKINIDEFVTFGASKRGWTTWLSAVVDKRVKAIAPLVYDNLDLEKQMALQLSDFGEFSEQIEDYTKLGIPEMMMSNPPSASAIGKLVDPFAYVDKIKVPKLIILGSNDRYWPIDAINIYYKELPGETFVHYVPNAGHDLGGKYFRVADVISEFVESVENKTSLPRLSSEYSVEKNTIKLKCTSTVTPEKIHVWVAKSLTKDFRDSKWKLVKMNKKGKFYTCDIIKPAKNRIALFVEAEYPTGISDSKKKKETYVLSDKVKVF